MVRWAPLNVPWSRRLQTLGVVFWVILSPLVLVPLSLTLYVMLLPTMWPVLVPYVLWIMFFDKAPIQAGRPSKFFRTLRIWTLFKDYFPIELIKTADLKPEKNYIFCYHPHGVISLGAISNFATEATGFSEKFPGIDLRVLTLKLNFYTPFAREFVLAAGMCDVSATSCHYNLSRGPGSSILIVIGGAQEALDAHPGINNLTLKNRKGFVKVALQHGAALVPIFSFGENNLFAQIPNPKGSKLRNFQDMLQKKLGFSMPLFQGRGVFNYDFGVLPHRRPITTVVGEPLELPHLTAPTQEQIDEWHARYVEALVALYNQYKDVYDKDRKSDIQIL